MDILRKAWVAFVALVLVAGAGAATNEYYTKAEVKKIVDDLFMAYGGVEKLKQFDRIKIVMDVKEGAYAMKGTIYQVASKARMDVEMAANQRRVHMVNIFDGKDFVSTVNGQKIPTKESDKLLLKEMVNEGVFQAALLGEYLNKERQLLYRGKKKWDGKTYDVIETVNDRGVVEEHYIDPETHREIVEVRRDKDGTRTHIFEAFGEYEGALYPKRALIKGADGSVRGSWVVKEVTKEFSDEVFAGK